jgi:hypothetical protein
MRVKVSADGRENPRGFKTNADGLRDRPSENIRRGLMCINVPRRANTMIGFLEDGRHGRCST